jgi:hypothetical protein
MYFIYYLTILRPREEVPSVVGMMAFADSSFLNTVIFPFQSHWPVSTSRKFLHCLSKTSLRVRHTLCRQPYGRKIPVVFWKTWSGMESAVFWGWNVVKFGDSPTLRRWYVPPKRRAVFELHGVTNQKTVLFIVTAVGTSHTSQNWVAF